MDIIKLSDSMDLSLKDYSSIWKNNGILQAEDGTIGRVEMKDAITFPSSTNFLPVTIQNIVRDSIEPNLVGTKLLDTIKYSPNLNMVNFNDIGSIVADDIGETGEFPEYSINYSPGTNSILMGKSGVACKFSEEVLKYSQYNIVSIMLDKMGKALARHKESKIFNMIGSMGTVTHDNANPSQSIFGTTTGMDYQGSANGTVTADDFIEAYGQLLANGFTGNVAIVHPLTYTMFMTDPVLRSFALNHGGGAWFNGYNGSAKSIYPFERGMLGKAGPGQPNAKEATMVELQNTATMKMPDYFGMGGLVVMQSLAMPYNPQTKLTDIMIVDSANLGALVVDEPPSVDEIPDVYRDLKKIKIKERYALSLYNEGNAAVVMKNIKVSPSKVAISPYLNLNAPSGFNGIARNNSVV